ncbi:UNKNOWN [Stylonychia lemnae]|uniref:Uncharacterized protein n=1 Tax=Stylonychia lemnae TaxID=5949 RepID=A0A078APQ5_STYLE|nr:UNKNOWN [Stylonychia lemnae]|eukprot:CDW83946.1 UNKNOWN [Stylonychia lemnae]
MSNLKISKYSQNAPTSQTTTSFGGPYGLQSNLPPHAATQSNFIANGQQKSRRLQSDQNRASGTGVQLMKGIKSKAIVLNDSQQEKSQAADLMKIFGNERNFQLIKSLMDTSQVKGTQQKQNKRTISAKHNHQQSQKVIHQHGQIATINDDKEIKVEKAILDLNELKSQMFSEKNSNINATNKDQQMRKTNFSNFQQTSYSTQSAFTHNQQNNLGLNGPIKPKNETIYSNQNNISNLSNQAAPINLQQQQLPSVTQTSFFSNSTQFNFNKAQSLTSNIDNLDRDQLRERLLVAETLMKKLYNRNKELEQEIEQNNNYGGGNKSMNSQIPDINQKEYMKDANDLTTIEDKNMQVSDLGLVEQLKQREDQLIRELEEKQQEIDDLKHQNQEIIKKQSDDKNTNYSYFLEEKLAESQLENRRMLLKYTEIRNFAYQQIEQHIKQMNKKRNNNIQNNNLQVYKQMIERERKHWQYEIENKQQQIDRFQLTIKDQEQSVKDIKERVLELEDEIETRDACEAKVQEYVKTIVEKNEQLQQQLKQKS